MAEPANPFFNKTEESKKVCKWCKRMMLVFGIQEIYICHNCDNTTGKALPKGDA